MRHQTAMFEEERLSLDRSLELTIESLTLYGQTHQHWAMAFSGGKDSTAVVTVVAHLILTGQVPAPKTLRVLYADTRMELPPLQASAMAILRRIEEIGIETEIVLPPIDDRYMVYLLGRGAPHLRTILGGARRNSKSSRWNGRWLRFAICTARSS